MEFHIEFNGCLILVIFLGLPPTCTKVSRLSGSMRRIGWITIQKRPTKPLVYHKGDLPIDTLLHKCQRSDRMGFVLRFSSDRLKIISRYLADEDVGTNF